MADKTRFRCRRAQLKQRGLCVRCGREKARAGHTICILCASEKRTKKLVAPARVYVCEKRARLERNRAFCVEALRAIESELSKLG